jgi:hypothetical protein
MASATIRAIHNLYIYCKNKIDLKVYCNDNLHGKVYLLYKEDKPKGFFVTSANFTDKGLKNNQEYGIFADNDISQNDMLNSIMENDYDEITLEDVIRIENKSKEFEEKNAVKNIPVFKAKDYIIGERKQKSEIRYFLKVLGSKDSPYEEKRNIKKDNPIGISEKCYNRHKNRLPRKDDIFICHGAGKDRACIVGYCKLTTDAPSKEIGGDGDKWNYKYYIEDLNEEYSSHWYEYHLSMKTNSLRKEFIENIMPNQKIALEGNPLKINFEQGLIELSEEFAQFVIDKINNKTNG